METAAAAMEKVPLTQSSSDEVVTPVPPPEEEDAPEVEVVPPPEYAEIGAVPTEGPPGIFDRFLLRVHKFFYRFCHLLGHFFLRALSAVMLLCGIFGAVMIEILAYYYTGVLNVWVLLACGFYAPTLASMAVVREEMLVFGTSRSGTGPRMSQFVTFSYLVIMLSGTASLFQPLVLRGENKISVKSFWMALGGSAFFFYCMLISEVLFAAALNLRRAKVEDDEQRRRDREDPRWLANYNAISD